MNAIPSIAALLLQNKHSPIPRREIRGTPFPLSQGSERGKGEIKSRGIS